MNQEILKRLDEVISSNLLGVSKDPDCIVGASVCVIHKGEEVYRMEYGEADKEKKNPDGSRQYIPLLFFDKTYHISGSNDAG